MKNLTSCIALFLICLSSLAQEDKPEPAISVRAGIIATSTTVYKVSGTDTAYGNAFAVAPIISFVHSKGFALDYSPYFVLGGNQQGIYMHTITAGYENYDGKLFTIRTGYTHYIFTDNKSIPFSPISNEVYFATDYKKAWLRPGLSLSYGFGKDENNQAVGDFYAGAGVKHSFDFENADIFSSIAISPSLFINGGTNNYYSFLTTSKYISRNAKAVKANSQSNRGNGNGSGGGSTTTTSTVTSKGFSITNLEVGLYSDFQVQQVHIKPQGSIYVPLQNSTNNLSGYWQVNLEYYF